ncbi:Cleavage and polyadenylation specificity factor subunit 1, partial [Lonchura striata]
MARAWLLLLALPAALAAPAEPAARAGPGLALAALEALVASGEGQLSRGALRALVARAAGRAQCPRGPCGENLEESPKILKKNPKKSNFFPTEGKGQREKLELVASFSFFGNVMSMASVQLAGAKRDALLLSFKDAKLSVVEYDPGTHDLKTLSLHYFEEPELR